MLAPRWMRGHAALPFSPSTSRRASTPPPGDPGPADGPVSVDPEEGLGPDQVAADPGRIGTAYFMARISIDALALIDTPPEEGASEPGSNSLRQ
jgi:hypothetical protein